MTTGRRRARPTKEKRRRFVLPGGLVLLTEQMDHVRSATVGIWLKQGSRHEDEALCGISHFVEHLLFKGTEQLSCRDIARIIDRTGGLTDASTSKEFATFSVKVMDEHLPVALDLLTDILTRPAFAPEEIETERKVIFEEIRSCLDDPEDYLGEIHFQSYFRNHPLGRPILGTNESVAALHRDRIVDFFRGRYVPANLIVSAAGCIDPEALAEYFARKFPQDGREAHAGSAVDAPTVHPERLYVSKKDLEQAHISIGYPGIRRSHEDRYALAILNDILGGSMSSRLFQNIREKWGLSYSIFSHPSSFTDAGTLSIYTGVEPAETARTIRLALDEVAAIRRGEITQQEIEDSKTHIKGRILLSLESSSARMASLAINEMFFGRQFTTDEILDAVNRVSLTDVVGLANRLFDETAVSLVILGGAPSFDVDALDLRLS